MLALQREAAWAEERRLDDLRQSVLQNGRVHLHIIEKHAPSPQKTFLIGVVFLGGWCANVGT